MIPRGHIHNLGPVTRHDLLNGGGIQVLYQCECGLEARRTYLEGEEHPYRFELRYNGMWIAPLDLLRVAVVPFEECAECEGGTLPMIELCESCGGLGVTESGERLGMPGLRVHR